MVLIRLIDNFSSFCNFLVPISPHCEYSLPWHRRQYPRRNGEASVISYREIGARPVQKLADNINIGQSSTMTDIKYLEKGARSDCFSNFKNCKRLC